MGGKVEDKDFLKKHSKTPKISDQAKNFNDWVLIEKKTIKKKEKK